LAEHTSSPTLGGTPGTGYGTNRTTSQGSGTGTGIVDKVKEQATAQLSSQKDRATQGLGTVASAVRQTTQSLRDQQHDAVAGYVEQAADQIERFSERLKNKDVTELLNDAQQLARRQPAIFIGGAFALGLVGARFLKSSSKDESDDYRSGGTYGSYGSTSGAYGTGAYGSSTNRTNIGTSGSTGDVTGGRSTTDLGATGAAGYSGSNYGAAGGTRSSTPSTTPSTSSTTGSAGSTGRRDDTERF
jgi:hypothetical protein